MFITTNQHHFKEDSFIVKPPTGGLLRNFTCFWYWHPESPLQFGRMLSSKASPTVTLQFAEKHPELQTAGFYRQAQGLHISSIGLGSYLGETDDATDRGYTASVEAALASGINLIDTSLNYRHQRSERALAGALRSAARESFVVCTKAGYLVPGAIPAEALSEGEVVGGMHCMTASFLADQLERSRANLDLETIDVFYLHNPETQLSFVSREEFYKRCLAAFESLERAVSDGRIGFYGAATWNGFRAAPEDRAYLSLSDLVDLARQVSGDSHHFRFVQLPFNLAMGEAYMRANQGGKPLLAAAQDLNVSVIGSATLLQSRLSRDLPDHLAALFPGTQTDAQRAIQFSRSAPGLCASLIGMSSPEHVKENMHVAPLPPLNSGQFAGLFRRE